MKNSMSVRQKIIISVVLVAFGVLMRFVPHLWNFTPIIAIALFAGVYLGRGYAIGLPLAVMLLSDPFLGTYELGMMLAVYGSFALIGLFGLLLKKYKTGTNVMAASVLASTFFYLATNTAVWAFTPWYPAGIEGLVASLVAGIPFFKNALLGDMVYTAGLFGVYETASRLAEKPVFQKTLATVKETIW